MDLNQERRAGDAMSIATLLAQENSAAAAAVAAADNTDAAASPPQNHTTQHPQSTIHNGHAGQDSIISQNQPSSKAYNQLAPIGFPTPSMANNSNVPLIPSASSSASAITAASLKKRRRSIYPPLAPDNEDLVFEVLNPTHMEASFQYANQPVFQDEKEEYLATLRQRITNIQVMENRHLTTARNALQKKYLTLYTTKADALRKYATKQLYPTAMGNVLKFEELVEKEGKKLYRNQIKKERRAIRAAQLKAQKADALRLKAEAAAAAEVAKEEAKRAQKLKAVKEAKDARAKDAKAKVISNAKNAAAAANSTCATNGETLLSTNPDDDASNTASATSTPIKPKTKRGKGTGTGARRSAAAKTEAGSEETLQDSASSSSNTSKSKSKSKSRGSAATANGSSKDSKDSLKKLLPLAPATPLSEKTDSSSPSPHNNSVHSPKASPALKKETKSKSTNSNSSGSAAATATAGGSANASGAAAAAAASPSKKEPEKPKAPPPPKPPSQKEIRAIARLYSNTYDSVWKDMARRDANKVHRLVRSSANTRLSNLRKTAVLASKEARRWQFKTNKNIKDLQMKAKRGMREMLAFWKRNEREERDLRKRAEKEAQELAKKEEEQREARRQAKKLNFLISQTELYTHFISKKISPADEENNTDNNDNAAGSNNKISGNDLDFDSENEEELQKAALANARSAFAETQAHARSFDGGDKIRDVNVDNDEMNFQNPTSLGDIQIPQPKLLSCQLKEYQIKGLSWLANLYEQGINGILADEMGLGKTVQSISVMAYLAETYNIWGPFLVISPASTLHNWEQEIRKFVPDFKVLPYWGSAKDRKVLRKFWDHKNVKYGKDAQFHVLVTSYQLVVADASYFQKMKWQYMILDEAQAIKSSSSARWKSLLSFQCRNRLLLTGTPIQNSMQELWALLHFIMPTLFDSHDEFSEWFSKDIESHAQSNTQLNEQQLSRLHMILKPFMLRRLKKHVQSELGDKIEIDVYCELTNRQRELYRTLRSQISVMDLIEKAASGSDEGTQSLMNLVMQFRKVCNHPDLFERADTTSAFSFSVPTIAFGPIREANDVEILYNCSNLISFRVPKLMYRDGGFLDVPCEANNSVGFRSPFIQNMLNIWDPHHKSSVIAAFSLAGVSPGEAKTAATHGLFERATALHSYSGKKSAARFEIVYDEDDKYIPKSNMLLISDAKDKWEHARATSTGVLKELLSVGERVLDIGLYNYIEAAHDDKVQAPPISLTGSDRSIGVDQHQLLFDEKKRSFLYPMSLDREWDFLEHGLPVSELPPSDMFPWPRNSGMGYTTIRMPSMIKFVTDSGKLAKLDQMLPELKANDHRVLIYFQMTKMMDLMEEYLTFRQYKYVRLDGSSKLGDRRDLVNDWQTKPELFVFLLSTRAGGLGINLTAADTVIFYDSDWNPTIDSQAMDRAHRMGQTRQVTVYRLLVKGTIEERMRDRAKQKMHVQQVVMEGGGAAKSGVDFQKPGREVAYWLLDDDATADALIKKKQEEVAAAQGNKKGGAQKRQADSGSQDSESAGAPPAKKAKVRGIEDMYHEDEGNFDESTNPSLRGTPSGSGTATPTAESAANAAARKKGGNSNGRGASRRVPLDKRW